MTQQIIEQSEYNPFSLYLTEKDGKPIIVRKWFLAAGFDFETQEEAKRPMFDVIELKDVVDDADLDSFVQAAITGTHHNHPLSKDFRIERDSQRSQEFEEARLGSKKRLEWEEET